MAYFNNTFFAGEHFKAPFYGEEYFQGDYFADMPIAHGISAGTTSATVVTMVCTKEITGTHDISEYEVTINGVADTIVSAVPTVNSMAITVTSTIVAGDVLRMSHAASVDNNVGIIENDPVVNNEV